MHMHVHEKETKNVLNWKFYLPVKFHNLKVATFFQN